jgi:hypothetical protein
MRLKNENNGRKGFSMLAEGSRNISTAEAVAPGGNNKANFITDMRHLLYPFLIVLSFFPNKNSFGQKKNLSIYKFCFDGQLKAWTKTIKDFRLSSFQPTDTISFENSEFEDIKDLKKFYSVYKPALTFSNDKNQFIDIYSYWLNLEKKGDSIVYSGSDVDQAVSLCDIQAKKWTRILFCGYSLRIQDVAWLTNTKFILVGSVQNEESKYLPAIYIGNTTSNSFEIFSSDDPNCYQTEIYDSPKLAKLNIKEQ